MDMLSVDSMQKFGQARRQASLNTFFRFLTGQTNDLLSFDQVRQKLGLKHRRDLGVYEIGLDDIVGSVGRHTDFTREFYPRFEGEGVSERWRRVYDLVNSLAGLPPIKAIKVGDAYFVEDGNHRVSVARTNKAEKVQAHVVEYDSPVPLTPEDIVDDLLEYN